AHQHPSSSFKTDTVVSVGRASDHWISFAIPFSDLNQAGHVVTSTTQLTAICGSTSNGTLALTTGASGDIACPSTVVRNTCTTFSNPIACPTNNDSSCGLTCTDCTAIGDGEVCIDGVCGCNDDNDCGGGTPHCDMGTHHCVQCTMDSECFGLNPDEPICVSG